MANAPRYAGPLAQDARELDRELRLHLNRGDAAALEEFWNALRPAQCPRCGALLVQQLMDEKRPRLKPLADSDDSRRYPKLDILDPDFLATADQSTLLDTLVETTLTHSSTDTANAQLVDADRHGLYIAAHQGFERPFLDFFEWVTDDGSACATAAAQGRTVLVPDVMRSPLFTAESRQVMLDAGSYAVQSFPMVSSTGQLLGVFSCHYRTPGRPSDDVAPLVDALTKAAARSLQWQARKSGNGSPVAPDFGHWRAGDRVPGSRSGQSPHLAAGIAKIVTRIHRLLDDQS